MEEEEPRSSTDDPDRFEMCAYKLSAPQAVSTTEQEASRRHNVELGKDLAKRMARASNKPKPGKVTSAKLRHYMRTFLRVYTVDLGHTQFFRGKFNRHRAGVLATECLDSCKGLKTQLETCLADCRGAVDIGAWWNASLRCLAANEESADHRQEAREAIQATRLAKCTVEALLTVHQKILTVLRTANDHGRADSEMHAFAKQHLMLLASKGGESEAVVIDWNTGPAQSDSIEHAEFFEIVKQRRLLAEKSRRKLKEATANAGLDDMHSVGHAASRRSSIGVRNGDRSTSTKHGSDTKANCPTCGGQHSKTPNDRTDLHLQACKQAHADFAKTQRKLAANGFFY